MKKVNYGTFTNPPSLSFANYCDGLDAKRQGDTSRAINEGLQKGLYRDGRFIFTRIKGKDGDSPIVV